MTSPIDKTLPTLTLIIPTRNVERTIKKCLNSILIQDYPKSKLDIIIMDGRSTDSTLEIIKKADKKIKIVQGKYPNDPEASKGEALQFAKGEIVGFIDSDNYFPHKRWLRKMIYPLTTDKGIVGSYTWRFAYRKQDKALNRYFSLIGSADPVGLYLGKADKMSYVTDKWTGFGEVTGNFKTYFIIKFDQSNFPTLGSNSFFARKEYLKKGKSGPKKFFHIDVPFDILKFDLNEYAVVKDVIIHDTADGLRSFLKKRVNYMKLHYQKRSKDRRYKVFDPDNKRDVHRLIVFILFSLTIIQPLYISVRGYIRIHDSAWFLHPIFCFAIVIAYGISVIEKHLGKK